MIQTLQKRYADKKGNKMFVDNVSNGIYFKMQSNVNDCVGLKLSKEEALLLADSIRELVMQ